ncbi:MAG: hypothetical protein DMG13_11400 [Acidobacteria bacterium]|nr:MAG: hypothetical protein DMG13_11400 [Acidobacteriota bacterium]
MTANPKFNRTLVFGLGLLLALLVTTSAIPWSEEPRAATGVQVSIEQFGRYIDDWSEPEGYFDSDNFISNETSYLHVIDQLRQRVKPGGIYLGVGPDQNLSYIVHTRPSLAIITDIRRQNMLQHLLFKALFAIASNRLEYLSLLFSRETPPVKPGASFPDVLAALRRSPSSEKFFQKNLASVKDVLAGTYRLKLTADDISKIDYVYRTFWEEGPDLRFSSLGRGNALNYPTFEDILLETDQQGRRQNYLSSEELFQWLKKFQAENRVIPIVGDFAGPHAFKAISGFLRANGLRLSVFYTSNVEFYLFGRPTWARYVANVRGFPLSNDAVFIRSYFPTYGLPHPLNVTGHRSTSLVQPIARFLDQYDSRALSTYWDVVKP